MKRVLILTLAAVAALGGLAVAAQAGDRSGPPTKPAPFDVDATGAVVVPASVPVAGPDGNGVTGLDGKPVTIDPRPGPLESPTIGADGVPRAPAPAAPPTTVVYGG